MTLRVPEMRFGDPRRVIPKANAVTLAICLRRLEEAGGVSRVAASRQTAR
ncbi:winged helix-turn-helix transcriptional regulator [Streptomyces sp. A0642]|nr:winged helix-turn-helix transcriptional regulator [Streptomyces sp. A0642]